MPVITTPLIARAGKTLPRDTPAAALAGTGAGLRFWVALILLLSLCNLPLLAFLNARGVAISSAWVGMAEALVFGLCLALQIHRLPPWTVALGLGAISWIVLTWLIRQGPDLKSVRDLLIPILFISLGRRIGDTPFAERCVSRLTLLVLAIALFEVLFTSAYGTIFNTFSFYAGLGSIQEGAAMLAGQTLTLNGFRPDGIGRTLLPAILGAHRTSSLFLEPISLGNFAVILLAWNLSRTWNTFGRNALLLSLAALLFIVLSDSRFGMLMVPLLLGYRVLPMPTYRWVAPAFPFVVFASIVGVAVLFTQMSDTVLGRISGSGQALLDFDERRLMGLDSPLPGYGDMGYAYVLSRFGVLQVMALLLVLFQIPCSSERAKHFRALIVLYFFSSLAISGTSVFALKTAGLMWFLLGVLTADPRPAQRHPKQGPL